MTEMDNDELALLGADIDTLLRRNMMKTEAWLFEEAEVYDCCASSEHPI